MPYASYLDVDELRDAIGDSTLGHIAELQRAVDAASRLIDEWTGRYFYRDATATPRVFRAKDRTTVCCPDFDSSAGVIVKTDDDGDGVFETTWTGGQWQGEPLVRTNGQPFEHVTTTTRAREFPLDGRRPRVQVTAQWGWNEAPEPVVQACQSVSTLLFRTKDMAGNSIGIGKPSGEEVSGDSISLAKGLVTPYVIRGGTLWKPGMCTPARCTH